MQNSETINEANSTETMKLDKSEKIMQPKNHAEVPKAATNNAVVQKPATNPNVYTFVPTVLPKFENRKINIILLENSPKASKMKLDILKIFSKAFNANDFICVINYGEKVKKGETCRFKDFDITQVLNAEFKNKEILFYDALKILDSVVSVDSKKTWKDSYENSKITEISIIGIGEGIDVGSKVSKGEAISYFNKIVNKPNISTKYFCFTEDTFVEVAAMGFNSIGTFPQKKE